ncbi:hypothetical protein EJ110_NYTH49940 [Nymphaea thermarum]|nr:hypothetical protein EJ110_NYTH49940 [Nymphaea thermarum]
MKKIKHWTKFLFVVKVVAMNSDDRSTPGKVWKNVTYATYNASLRYNHYTSSKLFCSTTYISKNLNGHTFIQNFYTMQRSSRQSTDTLQFCMGGFARLGNNKVTILVNDAEKGGCLVGKKLGELSNS